MCDAELQVCQDALHAVEALLPRGPQVLLHGPGHRGEDGLSCLPRVHDLPRVFGGRGQFVIVKALDVGEGLLHRHHQPAGGKKNGLDSQWWDTSKCDLVGFEPIIVARNNICKVYVNIQLV